MKRANEHIHNIKNRETINKNSKHENDLKQKQQNIYIYINEKIERGRNTYKK